MSVSPTDAALWTPHFDRVREICRVYIWPVPLCYLSMHSNLKEKRQILRDTVNHIQTIHKEKGDRRKKNRKGLLTKILNFLHMGKHILCHLRYMYQLHLNQGKENLFQCWTSNGFSKSETVYTIKDYVMIVTGAIQHVKFQWQTILGFSQQRMNRV